MLSELVHTALKLPQFKQPVSLAHLKADAVKAAIEGGDIHDLKIQKLLALVEQLSD